MMMACYSTTHGARHFGEASPTCSGSGDVLNVTICPVAAIEKYMATTRAMQVGLTEGFLFRPTDQRGAISDASVTSEAMNGR